MRRERFVPTGPLTPNCRRDKRILALRVRAKTGRQRAASTQADGAPQRAVRSIVDIWEQLGISVKVALPPHSSMHILHE